MENITKKEKFLTPEQWQEITGLSRATMYALNYQGKLVGVVKFGPRLLRFKESEVLQWMETRIQ